MVIEYGALKLPSTILKKVVRNRGAAGNHRRRKPEERHKDLSRQAGRVRGGHPPGAGHQKVLHTPILAACALLQTAGCS